MLLFIAAFMGGALTIISPCILPIVPFVFARSDRPFRSHGLPLLVGMGLTFAVVAALTTIGGSWIADANEYGRWIALAILAAFGFALLLPSIAERVSRPLVALGNRLNEGQANSPDSESAIWPAMVLGISTGLLWTPCAGPILGVILTGAAINGASVGTFVLLVGYAAGACTSLAAAIFFGGRLLAPLKRSMVAGERLKKVAGAAVLVGVGAVLLGANAGPLTQLSSDTTFAVEQSITNLITGKEGSAEPAAFRGHDEGGFQRVSTNEPKLKSPLRVEGKLPTLQGATEWINSPPLTAESLRGKVVLVDFWTYSCINCLRTTPYLKAWAEKYRDAGLVVIGVHSPEFAFEKRIENVRRATKDLGITYPVAVDSDFKIWRDFDNQYWPAFYFVDAQGRIRHHQFGEGQYDLAERVIQQLLEEAGKGVPEPGLVSAVGEGTQAAPGAAQPESGETYLGYQRARDFGSPGGIASDVAHRYEVPSNLKLNRWALGGEWTVGPDAVVANKASSRLALRFHARDLHLVLGPPSTGRPLRFKVLVDGKPPMGDHGTDIDADGNGTIDAQRLYQLVRQGDSKRDRLFEIEFLDAGAQAFVFTFG